MKYSDSGSGSCSGAGLDLGLGSSSILGLDFGGQEKGGENKEINYELMNRTVTFPKSHVPSTEKPGSKPQKAKAKKTKQLIK